MTDVNSDVKSDPNYDESDSDDDEDMVNLDQNVARKKLTFTPSAYLPDVDDNIDLGSIQLEETLADKPLPSGKKDIAKKIYIVSITLIALVDSPHFYSL